MRTLLTVMLIWLTGAAGASSAPPADYPADRVLTQREQHALVRGWIEKRFDTVLPALMRREGIDMWMSRGGCASAWSRWGSASGSTPRWTSSARAGCRATRRRTGG